MREIINVRVNARKADLLTCQTELLCLGRFSDVKTLDKTLKNIDKKLDGAISELLELGDFKAKDGSSSLLYTNGRIPAKRILLVGLGEKKKADLDTLRRAASIGAKRAVDLKTKSIALVLHQPFGRNLTAHIAGQALAEGAHFGSYRYDEFVTPDKKDNGRVDSLNVDVIDENIATVNKLKAGTKIGSIIGSSQNLARTLANRPANVMYPAKLAEIAKQIASKTPNLTCTVLDDKQLRQKKMGGIIAVGQGSEHKPRMIIMRYKPTKRSRVKNTVGLIGKAITFDSGGISIKPSSNMDQMKMDMTGGAVVLATIKTAAELKLPVPIYAIICAAENAPGGQSYRPGDIITTYSGKTVEVLNTDAEGRMVLSDGIEYAKQQKCEPIIDVATLTGACMVVLGTHKAGLFSNDDVLAEKLARAAHAGGEPLWRLPCGDEYDEEMKSKIADLKNIGSRYGGACTGASFLGCFAGDTKWAHLDIAGKMDPSEPLKKITTGGSLGFGVRLLTAYLTDVAK